MVGSENKLGSVFSWAEEVEKEEAAAAQKQVHEKQKPNPFGSARPREVVLQEKGIDWRKLDQNLQQPSLTRYEPPKEKPRKENIPAPVARLAANNKQPFHPIRKDLERKRPENIKMESIRREVPQVLSATHNNIPEVFISPLKYPPKNIATLLKETRSSYNPRILNSGRPDFQYKSFIEPERDQEAFHECRLKQFHNSQSLASHFHQYNSHIDQHKFNPVWESQHAFLDCGRRNFYVEEWRYQSMEELHNSTKTGKSEADEEWPIAYSNYKRTKFFEQKLVGPLLGIERRGGPPILDDIKLPSVDGRDSKKIHDDYARRDGIGKRWMNSPSVETEQNGRRRRYHYHYNSDKEKTSYQGNYNSGMLRHATEEISSEKMEYDEEEQKSAGKFVASSREAVSHGGRATGSHKKADFGRNYRKKGMKLKSANRYCH